MRFFVELAYKGTNYCGWQIQPNALSIQQVVAEAFSTILQKQIEIVGCGRTDAGVHARQYFLHFDFEEQLPHNFISRINKFLPTDIALKQCFEVNPTIHARFDALQRTYAYHIVFHKDPFLQQTAYYYPYQKQLDYNKMQAAAALLMNYDAFFPFCKTNSDAKTMNCILYKSEWELLDNDRVVYHISANRFLRGMVRLIVGMCIHVGIGKTKLEDLVLALDQQKILLNSYSAPAKGLFLTAVKYPIGINKE
ncbi:MAG TPA: tRNA pseudouridine(38-40) synthase TruA [Saprospiraceae bacterium]|nr:tRNA pseudouridine(38-40) synthase TruA [Saprospiraceae bacterium]